MAEKKKIIFIVNPVSGTSGKNFVLKLVEDYLDKSQYDYEVMKTEYGGHATELAQQAAEQGADIVCAIGGDGTVNEVATGLIHTQTALAIIPSGSGNGLARHLRIPTDPLSAIKIINRGLMLPMDYGIVNKRPFFITGSAGSCSFSSSKASLIAFVVFNHPGNLWHSISSIHLICCSRSLITFSISAIYLHRLTLIRFIPVAVISRICFSSSFSATH